METQTVYKICKMVGGQWRSVNCSIVSAWTSRVYRLNMTTRPVRKNWYLMAFDTLENAISFKSLLSFYSTKISLFECIAEIVQDPPQRIACITYEEILWRNSRITAAGLCWKVHASNEELSANEQFKFTYNTMQPPQGTVFCKWIVPQKQLAIFTY